MIFMKPWISLSSLTLNYRLQTAVIQKHVPIQYYMCPQKTQQYMYVYMLMHYKSSCTVPQPAAWLTVFLSAHVQYYVKHSYSLYFLSFIFICIG